MLIKYQRKNINLIIKIKFVNQLHKYLQQIKNKLNKFQ